MGAIARLQVDDSKSFDPDTMSRIIWSIENSLNRRWEKMITRSKTKKGKQEKGKWND